jgi:hypothetical protein
LKGHELALNSHPPSHTVQTPECRYDRPKGETGLQPVERTFLITIATSFFFFIPTTSERKIKLATSRSSVLKHFGLRTLYTYQKAKRKKKTINLTNLIGSYKTSFIRIKQNEYCHEQRDWFYRQRRPRKAKQQNWLGCFKVTFLLKD